MAACAIHATSRSNTSTATTAATASRKAARKSRSGKWRDSCLGIWGRGSIRCLLIHPGLVVRDGGCAPPHHEERKLRQAEMFTLMVRRPAKRVVSNHEAKLPRRVAGRMAPLIHLAVLARPIRIAQIPPQDLGRGIARQRFDEVDRRRRLESGE